MKVESPKSYKRKIRVIARVFESKYAASGSFLWIFLASLLIVNIS
jgi:hypothetical protein